MLEFAQIETCKLLDLFETVNEGITVHEKLSRGFRNVQVVIEKCVNGLESFSVEAFERAALEYFLKEHFAKSRGELVDKSADTEAFIVDNVLFGIEYLADLEGNLCVLIGTRKFFYVGNDRADTDMHLEIEFRLNGIDDASRDKLECAGVGSGFKLLNKNYIRFAYVDNVIVSFVGEHILNNVIRDNFAGIHKADKNNDAVYLAVKAKLLGFYINIAGENIVENDVFDKVGLVVFFIIESFDIGEGNRKKRRNALCGIVSALYENYIFDSCVRADGTVGIVTDNLGFVAIGKLIDNVLVNVTDFRKLTAGDNNALVVDYTDFAVDRFSHLINQTLKQLVTHFASPFI